jgi:hypothetical protein
MLAKANINTNAKRRVSHRTFINTIICLTHLFTNALSISHVLHLYIVTSSLACLPNSLAILVKYEWDRDEKDSKKSKQTTRPVHAEFVVHRCGEQWEASSERRSEEVVAGVNGCSVLWVGITEIVQHRVKEQECTDCEEG